TFDLLVIFRDRQAAFLVHRQFLGRGKDLGVDEDARLRRGFAVLVALGQIHGDEPQRLRDLDRRQPNAGRVVHGFQHIVGKLAYLRRDLLDRFGDQTQLPVGQDDDFSEGHGGDLSRAGQAVNAAGNPVNDLLTIKLWVSLTIKINGVFTTNVRYSFAATNESARRT